MSHLRRLIAEIHRRSLWQVLGIYLVGAWLVWQVVGSLYEWIGLPDWVPGTALVLLLIGLPIVMATAFVQEGAPGRGGDEWRPMFEGFESTTDTVGSVHGAGEHAAADQGASPERSGGPPARRALFTWPRAITGGVLAFALLGLATTGFMGMRALGIGPAGTLIARGELTTNAAILIADFDAPAEDSSTALAVTEALRIDLPQSAVLRVVDHGEVGPALQRMGLEPTARLSEPVARDLAVREGIEAVLVGEVRPLGSTLQLTARLVTADSGKVLLRAREVAERPDQVVSAVDRLSERIRERAGESLKSIRESEPLLRATTHSLEALQLYSRAQRIAVLERDNDRAAELLEQALALDSTFAMGWRKYGAVLYGTDRPRAERVAALTTALRFADRLPPVERYMTIATYYGYVEYDPDRVIAAYNDMIDLGIAHGGTYHNLSLAYYGVGEFPKSAEAADRSVELSPTAQVLGRQIVAHASVGDLDGAERAFARRAELYPDLDDHYFYQARLAYYRGERDSARAIVEREVARRPRAPAPISAVYDIDQMEGRLRASAAGEARANRIRRDAGNLRPVLFTHLGQAQHALWVMRDPDAARERLDAGLEEIPLDTFDPLDRPYLTVVELRALLGEVDEAKRLLEERAREVPAELRQEEDQRTRSLTQGMIALGEGREEEALERLRDGTQGHGYLPYPYAVLAWAYDLTGRADSAIAAYRRYDELRHWSRMAIDDVWLAPVLERLGQLHDDRGDRQEAALYYARFVELWEEADPELQPRVEAARRALARLTEEGGR